MPKGTRLHCVAHYDNSAQNLANPNPRVDVTWGDQTWEEMMIGFFTTQEVEPMSLEKLATAGEQNRKAAAQRRAQLLEPAKAFIKGMDKNDNGTLSSDDIPPQWKNLLGQFDADSNGEINPSESAAYMSETNDE